MLKCAAIHWGNVEKNLLFLKDYVEGWGGEGGVKKEKSVLYSDQKKNT